MRLIIQSLLALAAVLPTHAFTNGTLIPSYFCNPVADGMPKSLGQLIPFLQKEQDEIAFNPNVTANLLTVPKTGSNKPGNAGYILASFHNTLNRITPVNPGLGVTVANSTAAVPTLKAGVPNLLVLNSLADGVAIIGALIHSRTMNGTPVGEFADSGKIFVPFPGCGKNAQGKIAGVVHSNAVSETSTYSTLTYTPPKCAVPGNTIVLGGLSVTDNGFGVWNVTFAVTGATPAGANGKCTSNTLVTKPLVTTGTGGVVTIVEVLGSKSVHTKEKREVVEERYEATKPRDVRLRSEVAFEA